VVRDYQLVSGCVQVGNGGGMWCGHCALWPQVCYCTGNSMIASGGGTALPIVGPGGAYAVVVPEVDGEALYLK